MSDGMDNASIAKLRHIVGRVERIEDQIAGLNEDKSGVYQEAKSFGLNVKAVKALIAKRRKVAKDPAKFADEMSDVELYEAALETPSSRVHAREADKPKERAPRSAYQDPRTASPRELIEAHRAGNPISQDFTFQDASIYFAVSQENACLKIGISNNVPQRIAFLAKECRDVELLGTVPGNRQEELRLLERFAFWQVEGEWFTWCPETEAMVTGILGPISHDPITGEIVQPVMLATEIEKAEAAKRPTAFATGGVIPAGHQTSAFEGPAEVFIASKVAHVEPQRPAPYRIDAPTAPKPPVEDLDLPAGLRREPARSAAE